MTRYVEREWLHELLLDSADPTAQDLAEIIERNPSVELLAVESATAADMLSTYEIRLVVAGEGAGPPTRGLAEFVGALRESEIEEMFAVRAGEVVGIGLLSPTGDLVAVTSVGCGG